MKEGTPTRLTQLDGLRGIAALVILLCHSVAVFPSLGQIFLNRFAPLGPAETWAVTLGLLISRAPLVDIDSGSPCTPAPSPRSRLQHP